MAMSADSYDEDEDEEDDSSYYTSSFDDVTAQLAAAGGCWTGKGDGFPCTKIVEILKRDLWNWCHLSLLY